MIIEKGKMERERATHDTYYDYEPNRFLFFIIYYLIIIK